MGIINKPISNEDKIDKKEEIKNEIINALNNLKSNLIEIKTKIKIHQENLKFDENIKKQMNEILNGFKNDVEYILNEININNKKEVEKNDNSIEIEQKNLIPKNVEIKSKFDETKRIINIPNSGLDFFTSRDIQNENKIITREIQKKAMKQIKDSDKKKNESFVNFLRDVADISRKSFIKSKEIMTLVIKDYENNFKDKKELSSFFKKDKGNKYLYNRFFQKEIVQSNNEQKYLENLSIKLTTLYFHCELAFPPIDINFKIMENEFNPETMIDILNFGKGKVNFAFLPSLYSNDNFLENGKLWVYTFKEEEFYLDEKSINILNEILK